MRAARFLVFSLAGAVACGGPSNREPTVDLAGASLDLDDHDDSKKRDLAQPPDLKAPADPADLAMPVEPDLSMPVADLAMHPTDDLGEPASPDAAASGPANATCAGAIPVQHNFTTTANTTGATESLGTQCRSGARGGVLYYSITLEPNQRLTATVTPAAGIDAVVRILDSCAATSCLVFADNKVEDFAETVTYANRTQTPKPLIIAISSYNELAPGALGLAVMVENLPTNNVCATPIVVSNGTSLTGQDPTLATDNLSSACLSATGKVLYYQAVVPAAHQLKVSVVAQSSWDPVIRILPTCGGTTCVASADSSSSTSETLLWPNNKSTSQTVLIAVGSFGSTATAPFNMTVEIAPALLCSNATPVTTLPAAFTAQDFGFGTAAPCTGTGFNRYYRVNVPNGHVLRATATPSSSYDAAIRLIDGTCPSSCIASQDTGASGTAETLVWENPDASPRDVVVAMGGLSVTSGAFNANIAVSPVLANTTCATATTVSEPATLYVGQNTARGTAGPSCIGNGQNLYWKVTVPVNSTLRVTATPNSSFDTAIRLIDESCPGSGTSTCIASADVNGSGLPDTLVWKNSGASERTVVIGVGRRSSSSSASNTDVNIELIPPPPNADCAQATPVTNGTTLTGQSTTFAFSSLNSACIGPATGKVLYYSITLQPGQTLNAMATPQTNWDPVIRLLRACGDTSCVASADAFATGAAEIIAYQNTSSDAEDLLIAVGSYDDAVSGRFSLAIQAN